MKVSEELMKLGLTPCKLDPAVFYVHKENRLWGILCCHVDNFLHAGDDVFEILIKKTEGKIFCQKSGGERVQTYRVQSQAA